MKTKKSTNIMITQDQLDILIHKFYIAVDLKYIEDTFDYNQQYYILACVDRRTKALLKL